MKQNSLTAWLDQKLYKALPDTSLQVLLHRITPLVRNGFRVKKFAVVDALQFGFLVCKPIKVEIFGFGDGTKLLDGTVRLLSKTSVWMRDLSP